MISDRLINCNSLSIFLLSTVITPLSTSPTLPSQNRLFWRVRRSLLIPSCCRCRRNARHRTRVTRSRLGMCTSGILIGLCQEEEGFIKLNFTSNGPSKNYCNINESTTWIEKKFISWNIKIWGGWSPQVRPWSSERAKKYIVFYTPCTTRVGCPDTEKKSSTMSPLT